MEIRLEKASENELQYCCQVWKKNSCQVFSSKRIGFNTKIMVVGTECCSRWNKINLVTLIWKVEKNNESVCVDGWQLIKSENQTKNVKQSICFLNKIVNQFHSNLSIPFNREIRKYMYCVQKNILEPKEIKNG